jgi:hypothetical protein
MSLANMSIIEKDDLIKKMPKDALKRELREPSGNLPLFLIAARLKEVESMEQEAMANQFAQEAQGDEPTIAHRLAREIMPQAPLSGMAAMPSPQPRPDPQGQMAQALAGPRREMPTVYRNMGGLAALGGAAMPATYEALMQNPEILGLGPFLASRFLGGDDDTPDPSPTPVPQERPVLPPTVQVQPNQVPGSNAPVQIAGGDTLPTVRAQSGLKGKYPGDAARVTAEMLAAAARRRKESGKPRLYNQGRKISFEETIKKGASPAAQMAAMFGIPSAIARQEERVFGGMDTLPPYQPESNPMALRSKGFTSPTRTLAHRGADEGASGLDYLKMMKDIAGDSDDLPTVFAQDGFPGTQVDPRTGRIMIVDDTAQSAVTDYLNYPGPMPGSNEFFYRGNQIVPGKDFVESQMKRASGIQAAAGGMDVDPMSQMDLEGNPVVSTATTIEAYNAAQAQKRAEEEAARVAAMQQRNRRRGRFSPQAAPAVAVSNNAAPAATSTAPSGDGTAANTEFRYTPTSQGAVVSSAEDSPQAAVTPQVAGDAQSRNVLSGGSAQDSLNIDAMRKRLGLSGKTEPIEVGAVDSIKEFQETYGALLPDQSKARQKITQDYEKALQEEKDRDVVPQGLKDIRSEYENRIKALDKSGLPFMTAAAAVLKGNQPTLVALTNAMIGYTAGDEQLKKQGLSLIKDMSKLDIEVATLEAAQREQVNKARTAVMKAREAELTGNEARAAAVLDVASKAQISAQNLAIKKAEMQNSSEQRKVQIFSTIAPKIIETERDERMLKEATQAFRERGLSDGEAKIKALTLLEGRGSSPFAMENQMLRREAAELKRDNQITKFFANASKDPARNLKIRDAAKKDGLQLTGDDLMLYGVQKGLVPITDALRNTPAGQSIVEQAKQKFGPQAQGSGQDNNQNPLGLKVPK